jgi:hypothetical protein
VTTAPRRALGLSNTTFRRHFPDIARDIAEAARTSAPGHYDQLVARNATSTSTSRYWTET